MGAANLFEECEFSRLEGGSIDKGSDLRQDDISDGEWIINMYNSVRVRERWRISPRLLIYRSDWMGSGL